MTQIKSFKVNCHFLVAALILGAGRLERRIPLYLQGHFQQCFISFALFQGDLGKERSHLYTKCIPFIENPIVCI